MKFNFNNYVEVVLTKRGAQIYNEYQQNRKIPEYYKLTMMEEGTILREQLWYLFRIFGESMILGYESVFDGGIINFDAKDFV